jgi:hypothetical protein
VVWTKIDATQRRTRLRKLRRHPLRQSPEVVDAIPTASDICLICHHHKREPGTYQLSACWQCVRHEREILYPVDMAPVNIHHPVPIEENRRPGGVWNFPAEQQAVNG